jgi:ribonuclease T1
MPRLIKHWVLLLSVLCVAAPFGSPSESRAHSVDLATADNEAQAPALPDRSSLVPRQASERTAPQKAHDLLDALQRRNGTPLPGYIGGHDFRNRERRLPRGRYREYDVNRKIPGRSRDAERLVIEQHSGKAYYTDDHYRTFIPLN